MMEETHDGDGDTGKPGGVRRPMNAFLIFCKRHRTLVREKNPQLDNRSVTRILGDLWANLPPDEKSTYINLAKEYKEAFLKANPDYKWYNPDKHNADKVGNQSKPSTRPTNAYTVYHGQKPQQLEGSITPGKLADPSDMGGLSLLLMAGQQSMAPQGAESNNTASSTHSTAQPIESGGGDAARKFPSEAETEGKGNSLFQLAEMCSNQLAHSTLAAAPKVLHAAPAPAAPVIGPQEKDAPPAGSVGLTPPRTPQYDTAPIKQEPPVSQTTQSDLRPTTQGGEPLTKATISWREPGEKERTTVRYTELKIPSVPWSKGEDASAKPQPGKVSTSPPEKLKGRAPTLLSPAGAGLSRLVVDKVIETVYSSGLVLGDLKPRPGPAVHPRVAGGTAAGAGEPEKLPYTFGEIQETLIRKAVEDSYGLLRNAAGNHGNQTVPGSNDKDNASSGSTNLNNGSLNGNHRNMSSAKEVEAKPHSLSSPLKQDVKSEVVLNEANVLPDKVEATPVPKSELPLPNSDGKTKVDSNGNIPREGSVEQLAVPQSALAAPQPAPLPEGPILTPAATGTLSPIKKKRKKTAVSSTEMGPPSEAAKPKKKRVKKPKPVDVGVEGSNSPCGSVIKAKKKKKKKVEVKQDASDGGSSDGDSPRGEDKEDREDTDPGGQDSDLDDPGVRKSKRSNRGQRYKELISQGIIHPTRKKPDPSEEPKEEAINLSAIRRQRKRTVSESSVGSQDGSKRYKTGDFDLEAHIASLPAVSLDGPAGKKGKSKGRTRHLSSQSNSSLTSSASETQRCQGEGLGSPASTICSNEQTSQNQELNIAELRVVRRASTGTETSVTASTLTGSQKRKARKSSITRLHLINKEQKQADQSVTTQATGAVTSPSASGKPEVKPDADEGSSMDMLSTCINLKALANMATESVPISTEEKSNGRTEPLAVTCT